MEKKDKLKKDPPWDQMIAVIVGTIMQNNNSSNNNEKITNL